ncbi:hypothetical protein DAKH74_047020 [Maudiozyma humilis]|uniref:ADP-ribosylation factor GTPase-activating protein n=1 Tax=Maudiozyma humilis TaxID=51915 RepID=A0AAV5S3S6_MAUHU|nr:hypothetical protein DAKH74_047020 [Kazachstania humilis]
MPHPQGPFHHGSTTKARSFERLTHLPLFAPLAPLSSSSSTTSISGGSPVHTHNAQGLALHSGHGILLQRVQAVHSSNLRCCDCGANRTVDWVSINLLCVLCIKCSGAHRSLGSHVSKVRSLTLDSFRDAEQRYLLRHSVNNSVVNAIYAATLAPGDAIAAHASDSDRAAFVRDKYVLKRWVSGPQQGYDTSLKSLIAGIHEESVAKLQRAIAQSKEPLRVVSQRYTAESEGSNNVSLFKYALKHNWRRSDGSLVFAIAEFLLLNDLVIDTNVPTDPETVKKWPVEALDYWHAKLDVYGDVFLSIDSKHRETKDDVPPMLRSQSTNTHKKRQSSIKRWSLASIPKAPQNIISMHKSLRRAKKDSPPS